KILTPINAILFINFAPVTTVVIQMIQGYKISFFEYLGVFIVCLMIILNNLYQRMMIKKNPDILPTSHKETDSTKTASSELLISRIKNGYLKKIQVVALKKSLIKNTSPTRILREIKRTRFDKKFDQNGFILCEVLYIFLKKV